MAPKVLSASKALEDAVTAVVSLTISENKALAAMDLNAFGKLPTVGGNTPFEHCVSRDYRQRPFVFEPSRYYAHGLRSWTSAAVDRTRYSYPPATCVGDIDFSLVPGCPTCEQKWRESATRTDLGWCDWQIFSRYTIIPKKHCGFSETPPRGERLTCVTEGNSDGGDDGGGSPGSASLAIIIPVVIAAVLLLAAILFLVRKRVVAARQHRRESMPTVGGDEAEAEA